MALEFELFHLKDSNYFTPQRFATKIIFEMSIHINITIT